MFGLFKKKKKVKKSKHYNVYVVLLDKKVSGFNKVIRLNPRRKPKLPCVYVGMTGLDIKKRYSNHKRGYKSSGWVKKYGIKLMPKLYKGLNPMNYDKAVKMEVELAGKLRKKGYIVLGGH